MLSTWTCNETPNPLTENIKRAAQCRQLEYRKHLDPNRIEKKYEECIASIPSPIPANVSKISIGSPVGTSFGTIGIDNLKPQDISMQAYACCLIAFGMAFIIPEKDWTSLVINQILQDGKKLIETSVTKDDTVTKLTEVSINKRIVINNNMMEIEIFNPEYTGKVQSTDFTVPVLLTSLKKFFKFSSYGLLWFGNGIYYFIWRKYGMFFIWDAYGRDQETLVQKSGFKAALVALRCPENLYYYIVHLAEMNSDEIFSIRNLQIAMIIENCCNSKINEIKRKSPVSEFQVIGEKYAILRGHTHVGSICFKEFRYKQSLGVAVIALLYSKISPPCSWDRLIVDEIVILGTIFYKVWNSCAHCFDLVIYDVPKRIRIGQYMVEISVNVKEESGEWKCVSNYKRSALTKAIKNCFTKSANILLQVEGKTYAIWKRNDIYYIFDPYEHQANRGEFERYKSSMLHMCSTISQCCLILTQLILEIPTVVNFYLHSVRILNISDCRIEKDQEGKICCLTRTSGILDNEEVVSLNESVEDFACQKTFECIGGIREDDDISQADLNSAGMSETQIPKDYFEIQDEIEYEAEIAAAENRLKEELEKKLTEEKEVKKDEKEKEKINLEVRDDEIRGEEENEEIKNKEVEDEELKVAPDENTPPRQVSGSEDDKEKAVTDSKGLMVKSGQKDADVLKGREEVKDANVSKGIKAINDAELAKSPKDGESEAIVEDRQKAQTGKEISKRYKEDEKNLQVEYAGDATVVIGAGDVVDETRLQDDIGLKDPIERSGLEGDRDIVGAESVKNKGGKKDQLGKGDEVYISKADREDIIGKDYKNGKEDGVKLRKGELDEEEILRKLTQSSDTDVTDLIAKICQSSHPCGHAKKSCKTFKVDTGKETYKQKCLELSTCDVVNEKRKSMRCPTVSPFPKKLAVFGTEKCTYRHLCHLLKVAFKCTDRILAMTKFGNYIIFKCFHEYYLHDGCTCNVERFRYLDLSTGTAGFIHLTSLDEVIHFILQAGENCEPSEENIKRIIQDICDEYGS